MDSILDLVKYWKLIFTASWFMFRIEMGLSDDSILPGGQNTAQLEDLQIHLLFFDPRYLGKLITLEGNLTSSIQTYRTSKIVW